MGLEPGRLYSYDLLDNLGRPSARQILPQFQRQLELRLLEPDGTG